MGLKKYSCMPTARMQMFYMTAQYPDLGILDFSTRGHAVFNYGHLGWTNPMPPGENLFSAQVSESDLITGSGKRLFSAVDEMMERGYRHIFLMPSSISQVMGIDLEGYAAEVRERTDVDIFTVKAKLNADFYQGAEALYTALVQGFAVLCEPLPFTYNILGGHRYSDRINHDYLAQLMDRLGMKLNVDVQNSPSFRELEKLPYGQINIVTNDYALKGAEILKKRNGTPYICFHALSMETENQFLSSVAELVGMEPLKMEDDRQYEMLVEQLKNILSVTSPEIVCYADMDMLRELEGFFTGLDYPATYLCSHQKSRYPYAEPGEVIDRCGDKLLLSYDSVCSYVSKAIPIDESGLIYRIHIPVQDHTVGKEGAYRLIRSIGQQLLHR